MNSEKLALLRLRDYHRAEWENDVISRINRGFNKGEAENMADENLIDRYTEVYEAMVDRFEEEND